VEAVVYALQSKVLPPVTAALHVAERVRVNLMGAHKRVVGHPARVSERFSGKGADGTPLQGHQHAFVLPYDEDRDGKLDHVAVFCRQPFDVEEQLALDRMGAVWQPSGRPEVRCVPVRRGRTETTLKRGRVFQSATPFVPARHYRRGRGELSEWLAGEIRRECTNQNLPTPLSIRMLERFGLRDGRSVRWLEFDRNRKDDPARLGFGFELEFAEPMTPFALGYGCHFGLGQFHPVRVSD
jgi:CRISPR-associated protein Csb2